eukprot:4393467-Alexandrium_andersonii.AAC.1
MLPRCFVADAELWKKMVSRPTDALCHIIDRADFPEHPAPYPTPKTGVSEKGVYDRAVSNLRFA